MSNNLSGAGLAPLVAEAGKIADDARATFGSLSSEQLNWKPGAEQWSIGQCFDHLMTTNRELFPILEKIIRGKKRNTLWQSMPFLPGFFGRLFIKSLDPASTRKLKAPKIFKPSMSDISPTVINDFIGQQQEVLRYMEATSGLDLKKIFVTSPVSPVIIYNLMDAWTIIITHERRHFMQAERVMETEGFPQQRMSA